MSGVSGLIYQIVWTRELVLVFGNTMLATSTVLSAFMGGLAAGSYTLGRYIDRRPRKLIGVYALLEAGVGIFGLLFPLILAAMTPVYAALYRGVEGNIVLLNLVRFSVCFVIIVIPTFLMGGTLPVLIKRVARGDSIGHQSGFLYGLNTVGAVAGTIACGYFLLRYLGMQKTTWVAVAINLGVALAAWLLVRRDAAATAGSAKKVDVSPALEQPVYSRTTVRMVLIGIGLSGFCALSYEVFWTRMLNLFLNNNIYSFTAILATFLVGIAVGSLIYARWLSRIKQQIGLFIWLQIGIGVISYATPFIFSLLYHVLFQDFDQGLALAKTAVIMIAPTLMMGVAVPLAIQICQRGEDREGTSVGTVYSVNTIGAILGAFIAGFVLLPTIGLHLGVIAVASLNIVAGALPLLSTVRVRTKPIWAMAAVVVIVVMFVAAPANLFRSIFQKAHPNADILYYKEGKVANILVYDFKHLGYKDFHLNAVNEASSRLWHVQLFKMLGLLPTLVRENPTDALMVAFGAGMSAGAAARNVTSLDCVDLNPDIQGVAAAYTRENLDVIHQPNFHQIVNDGRNALLLDPHKYSLIISDATNPKMHDSWTLYSREFYQLVKDRLAPDGVFCQWALIPLPGDAIKVILNTFRSVFPHMSFWVIHGSTQVLMLGTPDRLAIAPEELAQRLKPFYDDAGLAEFGIDSVEKFLSFFMLGEDGLAQMLAGFDKISTDDLPHAQFYVEQDTEGIDNCLDLVRYQESILNYLKPGMTPSADFARRMNAYEDIARRLDVGFLTEDWMKYAEAAVVAADAGIDDANVAHMLNYGPEKKRHFEARLAAHPEDYTAHNWLGNILLLQKDYPAAEAEFKEALRLKPDHAYAMVNLAMTHMEMRKFDLSTEEFLAVRELSPTRRILQTVDLQLSKMRTLRRLSYNPDSPELNRALGVAFYNEGRLLDAVHTYRHAAELSGDDPTALYNLARIDERHEFVDEAANIYRLLSREYPEKTELADKGGEYSILEHDSHRLRQWLNSRIQVPDDLSHTAADTVTHPKTCDEALAIWNNIDPDGAADPKVLRHAAELYEHSSKVKPDDYHAYADAAMLYEGVHEYDRAARMWRALGDVRPDLTSVPNHVAMAEAVARLEGSRASGAERASLLREVGNACRAVDQPERAQVYLRQALDITPDNADLWFDYAMAAAEAGAYNAALAAADSALAIQPGSQQALSIKKTLETFVQND